MATYAKVLTDQSSNFILPYTRASLVYLDSNKTAQAVLDTIQMQLPSYSLSHFITDALEISTSGDYTAGSNTPAIFASESISNLTNCPISGTGAFYAYRYVHRITQSGGTSGKLLVILYEAYPKCGRIWFAMYNASTPGWDSNRIWVKVEASKDIALTSFSLTNSNVTANSTPYYVVSNGICVVYLDFIANSTVDTDISVSTSLPKAASYVTSPMAGSQTYSTNPPPCIARIDVTGQLNLLRIASGKSYMGSIVYPIA